MENQGTLARTESGFQHQVLAPVVLNKSSAATMRQMGSGFLDLVDGGRQVGQEVAIGTQTVGGYRGQVAWGLMENQAIQAPKENGFLLKGARVQEVTLALMESGSPDLEVGALVVKRVAILGLMVNGYRALAVQAHPARQADILGLMVNGFLVEE